MFRFNNRRVLLCLGLMLLVVFAGQVQAADSAISASRSDSESHFAVPFRADRWISNGNATFVSDHSFPDGVIEITKGAVEAKDLIFADGTIDFDMYVPDHGILGVRFRATDRDNAEALYFRPQKSCDTSSDCLQYMPLEHGAFEWDLFPEYQASAPVRTLDWNHFQIVVQGRTMRVYVNRSRKPALIVAHMEGGALSGGLIFGGPAKYANLVVAPTKPSPVAKVLPKRRDGFIRHWQISTASRLPTIHDPQLDAPTGIQPPYSTLPPRGEGWRTVTADAKGLVNFSHDIGSAKDGAVISLAWAKTTLVSDKAQSKNVQIGWVREIWVYVNGTLVFAGRNIEGSQAAKVADERISLENGAFRLPLKKGRNEIAIALDDNLPGNTQHYGWGMELKLRDSQGITAPQGSN